MTRSIRLTLTADATHCHGCTMRQDEECSAFIADLSFDEETAEYIRATECIAAEAELSAHGWLPIPCDVPEDDRRQVLVFTPHPAQNFRYEVTNWGSWLWWTVQPTHYMELPVAPSEPVP